MAPFLLVRSPGAAYSDRSPTSFLPTSPPRLLRGFHHVPNSPVPVRTVCAARLVGDRAGNGRSGGISRLPTRRQADPGFALLLLSRSAATAGGVAPRHGRPHPQG